MTQKSIPLICTFLLKYESTKCLGQIWFLIYGPKTSKSIGMRHSLNYSISQTS